VRPGQPCCRRGGWDVDAEVAAARTLFVVMPWVEGTLQGAADGADGADGGRVRGVQTTRYGELEKTIAELIDDHTEIWLGATQCHLSHTHVVG